VVAGELDNLKTQYPNDKSINQYIDAAKVGLQNIQAGPLVTKSLITNAQALLSPTEQQSALSPTAGLVSTGGGLQPTVTSPSVAGSAPSITPVGQAIPLTLPPTTPIVTPAGQPGYLNNGQFVASGLKPEDAAAMPTLVAEREQARTMLSGAPLAHTTNRGILEELDKVISTGQTGGIIARASSIFGAIPGNTDAEKAASAYDLIGKYTERNALEAAKSMGPGTNAGLEAAIKANGSAAYNPTALRTITKLNDAIVSGTEAYQPGLEKAIASSPNGIIAKRQFDQQWAQNFDPRVMMIYNAAKSGDKAEVDNILKSVGGPGSKGAADLARRAHNIQQLSQQGHL
jgi:hypothetical protein